MRNVLKLVRLEIRLFLREPMTLVFVLVLPLVMMYVLDGVFGNQAEADIYEGLGASTFYAPTYVALSVVTIGVLFLPVHLSSYREQGVLKRFRASALPMATVLSGHLVLTLALAMVSAGVLSAVALAAFDLEVPGFVPHLVLGVALVAFSFAALGMLLGMIAPSARSAQGLGVLLFFVFLILGGPGPPMEVLPPSMVTIADWLPMTYAGRLLRSLWVEGRWLAGPVAVMLTMAAASLAAVVVIVSRREA